MGMKRTRLQAKLKGSHRGKRGNFVTIIRRKDGKVKRKTYALEAVLNRRKRNMEIREIRDEQTKKREWWRKCVLSRDWQDSKAYRADYGDDGHYVDLLVGAIDGDDNTMSIEERNRAIINAAVYIAHTLGYKCGSSGYAEVFSIISTIALYGRDAREVLMKQFNLSYRAYIQRIEKYTKLLENR